MTLDTRARRAAQGIRHAVEVMEMSTSTKEPRKVERFDRFRDRKQRNRRIGALLVAAMLAFAAIVVATKALERPDTKVPVTPPSQKNGRIVFGEQSRHGGSNYLFTMNPDGTDVRDLSVESYCMLWTPDGRKILIDQRGRSGLATINADGTGYSEFLPLAEIGSEGCGALSPDGTRVVGQNGVGGGAGISTVRASDGGDLVRLTRLGENVDSSYSPDGAQVVFATSAVGGHYTKSPRLGGHFVHDTPNLYVVNVDGTGLHRIVPHTDTVGSPSWSPDGRLILFSAYMNGEGAAVYVVHPDGTGLRRITLEWVPRLRQATYPSWSPDGTRFVFVGWTGSDRYNLFTASRDGTDVEQITHTRGIYYRNTDWGTNAG